MAYSQADIRIMAYSQGDIRIHCIPTSGHSHSRHTHKGHSHTHKGEFASWHTYMDICIMIPLQEAFAP